eukprot:gene33222-59421_t
MGDVVGVAASWDDALSRFTMVEYLVPPAHTVLRGLAPAFRECLRRYARQNDQSDIARDEVRPLIDALRGVSGRAQLAYLLVTSPAHLRLATPSAMCPKCDAPPNEEANPVCGLLMYSYYDLFESINRSRAAPAVVARRLADLRELGQEVRSHERALLADFVGCCTMFVALCVGLLVVAFPVTILCNVFQEVYAEYVEAKTKKERHNKNKPGIAQSLMDKENSFAEGDGSGDGDPPKQPADAPNGGGGDGAPTEMSLRGAPNQPGRMLGPPPATTLMLASGADSRRQCGGTLGTCCPTARPIVRQGANAGAAQLLGPHSDAHPDASLPGPPRPPPAPPPGGGDGGGGSPRAPALAPPPA